MDTTPYKRHHPAFAIIQQLSVNMSTSPELMLDETHAMDALFKDITKYLLLQSFQT